MKIVRAEEMRRVESLAFKGRGNHLEDEFMKKAGGGVAKIIERYITRETCFKNIVLRKKSVLLICGKGNNAGDAYFAGCELIRKKYLVRAIELFPLSGLSKLCRKYYDSFLSLGGVVDGKLEDGLEASDFIVDGILGTGFKGELSTKIKSVIENINKSGKKVLSIDIPSGLDGNKGVSTEKKYVINADITAYLGLPKLGFFLGEAPCFIGKLEFVDFGLTEEEIIQARSNYNLYVPTKSKLKIPKVKKSRHKYKAGHIVSWCGSPGMMGAAALSTGAAMRSGSGLVKAYFDKECEKESSRFLLEVVTQGIDLKKYERCLHSILAEQRKIKSVMMIGPGIGRSKATEKLISKLVPHIECPLVLDADALNIFAQSPYRLPEQEIVMTPHSGELRNLLGLDERISSFDPSIFTKVQRFVEKYKVVLVWKGVPTFVFSQNKKIQVCYGGNPGMATAGSGDVLTGIIASLMSQGLSGLSASLLGVSIHQTAGEIAAKEKGQLSMIASDLIDSLPESFRRFSKE